MSEEKEERASGAPAAGSACVVCGQETSNDPGDFGTRCLRVRMGSPTTAGMVCFRLGYERLARQAVAPSKERHCIAALVAALKNVLGLADVDGGKHPWQARIVRDAVEALLGADEILARTRLGATCPMCKAPYATEADLKRAHDTTLPDEIQPWEAALCWFHMGNGSHSAAPSPRAAKIPPPSDSKG